jgi:hypothetical protein
MEKYRPISSLLRRNGRGGIVQEPILVKDDEKGTVTAMLLGKNYEGNILIRTEASLGKPVAVQPNTLACRHQ